MKGDDDMSLIEIFKVTVNHFRGYRNEKIFDFENSAEVIILAGPNGYGKTSIFDAIEWGFTGKLSRFEEPNEEKNNSCFINFQPFERNGEVYIEFGNNDDRYHLTRKSTYTLSDSTDYNTRKSTLCIDGSNIETLHNDKAVKFLNELLIKEEWRNKIDFTDIFSQYHVLTQDKIKKFIQGLKGPDRYKQVSMMVGTQRFYSYKNFFEKYAKAYGENAKEVANKKSELQIKINNIKELVHNDIKLNIGDCKTIEEWIDYLVTKYDAITDKLRIEKHNINKDLNLIDIVIDFKKDSLQTQEKLKNIKNKRTSLKEKLIDAKHNFKMYKEYQHKFNLYTNVLPLIDRWYKLQRINKQLPVLKEYNEFKQKNELNCLRVTNELKQTEIYLLKLTTLYNQIEFVQNEVSMGKHIDDKLEKLITNEVNLLQDNIPKFDDINEINIDSKSISFLEYNQVIDEDIKNRTNLNDLIKRRIDFYIANINRILANVLGDEERTLKLRKNISDLENDIKKVSKLETELRNILTESLEYIKSNNLNTSTQVQCPVCDSYFVKDKFIESIENKLISDNQDLSLMIKEKNKLEEQFKVYRDKLINSKELYKQFNRDFIKEISSIKNAITLLGQTIRKQEKKHTDELKNLNEENIRVQENHSSILALIKLLNLNNDVSKLEDELKLDLDKISTSLKQKGLNIDSLQIDDVKNIIMNSKQIVVKFEENLRELKIDMTNIEEDIEYKVLEVNNQLTSFEDIEINLKNICESFSEAHKELTNSEKMKELKVLEEQFKQLSIKESKDIKTVEILEKLVEGSTDAIQEISEQILTQHQEFINTIYKKINPHPLFTEVEFNFNKNNKGTDILNITCVNKKYNNKVNPAFTFSSAQVNIVAVSIFLGMALRQQCSNLKTILLDDPIQNMDDLNVISFIDILRNCLSINQSETTNSKQIVISTHDQDFYRLMMKKFRFVRNKSFEFVGYNNEGPEIR